MKIMKKVVSILLSLVLLAFCVGGCGITTKNTDTSELSASPEASADASADVGSTASPKASPPGNSNLQDDTLVFTVDDSYPVYWNEYKYWLGYSLQYAGIDTSTEIDWDQEYSNNETLREYIKEDAANAVILYKVIEKKASEMGIELTDDDKDSIQNIIQSNIDQFGSEEKYQEYLTENYLSDDLMNYLLTVSCYYYDIFVKMFGENGDQISDDDAVAFGNENGYYRAKHILMSTVDDDGNAYSDEELQEKHAKLENILTQINTSSDPTSTFDELMNQYSEDTQLKDYPDGYQFCSGDMAQEFEDAVSGLDNYGISDIIEIPNYGYSIVMRLPLDPDSVSVSDNYGYSLRYTTANYEFQSVADSWTKDAKIDYADAYDIVDPSEWF